MQLTQLFSHVSNPGLKKQPIEQPQNPFAWDVRDYDALEPAGVKIFGFEILEGNSENGLPIAKAKCTGLVHRL
jgi:hypothetical protein